MNVTCGVQILCQGSDLLSIQENLEHSFEAFLPWNPEGLLLIAGVIVSWPFAATTDKLSVGEEGVESLGFLGG